MNSSDLIRRLSDFCLFFLLLLNKEFRDYIDITCTKGPIHCFWFVKQMICLAFLLFFIVTKQNSFLIRVALNIIIRWHWDNKSFLIKKTPKNSSDIFWSFFKPTTNFRNPMHSSWSIKRFLEIDFSHVIKCFLPLSSYVTFRSHVNVLRRSTNTIVCSDERGSIRVTS